jgi:hypothetical protein
LYDKKSWLVESRYSDFHDLHEEMVGLGFRELPNFPTKKYLLSNAEISEL